MARARKRATKAKTARTGKRPRRSAAKGSAARKRRKSPARASIAKRAASVERAIETLGEGALGAGRTVKLGRTGALTLSRKSFKALDGFLLGVQRRSRRKAVPSYTLDIRVTYLKPDGTRSRPVELVGAGLPRLQDAARRRKRITRRVKGKLVKRLETVAHAYRRIVTAEVRKAVGRMVGEQRDIRGNTDQLKAEMKRATPTQAARALRDFKAQRGLAFTVSVNRHVTKRGKR